MQKNLHHKSIRGVLFDLDGTLLDTAPDFLFSLNQLRKELCLSELPLSAIRPITNLGSKAMLKHALNITEEDANFDALRAKFLGLYEQHIADQTRFFPEADDVLTYLESKQIPWGIVTNKLTRHTTALLKLLQIDHRPACVICGDTLTKYKPDPAPILHACQLINVSPAACLFVGDAMTDVLASKAAGTRSLVAMYGYINHNDNPHSWEADGYIDKPSQIIEWMMESHSM